MGFFNKFKKQNVNSYEDEEETELEEEEAEVNLEGSSIELKVIKPKSFEQILTVADALVSGHTVLLNLEDTDKSLCRRMIDFVSGVAYALDSNIRKATNNSYFIVPKDVDINGEAFNNKDDEDTYSDL